MYCVKSAEAALSRVRFLREKLLDVRDSCYTYGLYPIGLIDQLAGDIDLLLDDISAMDLYVRKGDINVQQTENEEK